MTGALRFAACLLVAALLATIGGAIFALLNDGPTTLTRSIAYGFWIAAALVLVGMAGFASRVLARRFDLPFIESWLFVTASMVLTGIGIVVDVAGT